MQPADVGQGAERLHGMLEVSAQNKSGGTRRHARPGQATAARPHTLFTQGVVVAAVGGPGIPLDELGTEVIETVRLAITGKSLIPGPLLWFLEVSRLRLAPVVKDCRMRLSLQLPFKT